MAVSKGASPAVR